MQSTTDDADFTDGRDAAALSVLSGNPDTMRRILALSRGFLTTDYTDFTDKAAASAVIREIRVIRVIRG
jgi:hypothetical protein